MGHNHPDVDGWDDAATVLSDQVSSLRLTTKTSGDADLDSVRSTVESDDEEASARDQPQTPVNHAPEQATQVVPHPTEQADGQLVRLPELPRIQSREIMLEVFMHRSVLGKSTALFEDSPEDLFPDNERLEHLGDAVIQLSVTRLIDEMYPRLRVGPASKVRTRVVNNISLAKHAVDYGMNLKLAVSHAQEAQLRRSVTVQGDLFEAYVGGLYRDRHYHFDPVYEWLKELLKPAIEEAYAQEVADHMITALPPAVAESIVTGKSPQSRSDLPATSAEQPVTAVRTPTAIRLPLPPSASTPLLAAPPATPRPTSAYSATRTPTVNSAPPSPYRFAAASNESGQLSYFNQCLIQRGKAVRWEFQQTGGNKTTPLWTVEAWLQNDNGREEIVGSAQAPTKKAAKNEAARQAIAYLKYA